MKNKITSKLFGLFALAVFVANFASAQNTGFMNPTDTAMPHGWATPLNGMVSDAQWATAAHLSGCNCPWLYLSWNKGVTYTAYKLMGPFGNSDSWQTAGSPTDNWGHVWIDSELNNNNFRAKIVNSSLSISQGYRNFNFVIPAGSTINGIELEIQFHGDSNFATDYLNAMEVNIYYTAPLGTGSVTATTDNVQVFPNPAHDQITLNTFGLTKINYTLMSMDGRVLLEENVEPTSSTFSTRIPVQQFKPGVYLLKVNSNEGTSFKKVIIE
jgi:hypothetical protein